MINCLAFSESYFMRDYLPRGPLGAGIVARQQRLDASYVVKVLRPAV